MCDVERAVHVLQELRKIGVRIALDDFGVGYSSLNYLIQFPVHTLKIDRTFTAGIQSAVNQTPIIGAIISLAKSLNLSVVAEGVETFQQFDYLREKRTASDPCFARPSPISAGRLGFWPSILAGTRVHGRRSAPPCAGRGARRGSRLVFVSARAVDLSCAVR
ncbi:EAL domain-containing protein [Alicyclobacillus sendaiensis]|uniref:EAL domain-containing protein n=1 Tax=Alicyclobacillus sendaiensis TaxID=192387 RepID=UPI00248181EA|nr:EAL domain-containing protein [Alicyclobacillus sendaiensis]